MDRTILVKHKPEPRFPRRSLSEHKKIGTCGGVVGPYEKNPFESCVPSGVPKVTNEVTSGEISYLGATVSDWDYVASRQ